MSFRLCFIWFIKRIGGFVGIGDLSHHAARHANSDYVGRNRLCNNTSRSNNGIIANFYTCKDRAARTDPNVVANGNGLCDLNACLSQFGVDCVLGGGKAAVWRDENVVAKADLGTVGDDKIVI